MDGLRGSATVRRTRGLLPVTAALVVALVAAGCSSGSGKDQAPAAVPAGFATYQGPTYTIAYPQGWQVTTRLVELHAITPARTMFDVLVRAPKEDFDNAQLGKALDSFRVTSP